MEILGWLLLGGALLLLARRLQPAEDPLALAPTVLVGIAGAVLGGVMASLIRPGVAPGLHTIVLTTLGAIVLMAAFRYSRRS